MHPKKKHQNALQDRIPKLYAAKVRLDSYTSVACEK